MRKVRRCWGSRHTDRTDFSPVHSPVSRVFLCAQPDGSQLREVCGAPEKECY